MIVFDFSLEISVCLINLTVRSYISISETIIVPDRFTLKTFFAGLRNKSKEKSKSSSIGGSVVSISPLNVIVTMPNETGLT